MKDIRKKNFNQIPNLSEFMPNKKKKKLSEIVDLGCN